MSEEGKKENSKQNKELNKLAQNSFIEMNFALIIALMDGAASNKY